MPNCNFFKEQYKKKKKQTSINLDLKRKLVSTDNICTFLFSVTLKTLLEVWTCALGCLIPIEIQNIITGIIVTDGKISDLHKTYLRGQSYQSCFKPLIGGIGFKV